MLVDRPKIQTAVGMLVVQKDGPHVRETIENPPMVNKRRIPTFDVSFVVVVDYWEWKPWGRKKSWWLYCRGASTQ